MARAMSPEREQEFEQLRAFVDFYMTRVKEMDPASPIHSTNVLPQIVAQYGRSRALEGLRQAVNDVLEELRDLKSAGVVILDDTLRSEGIVTVSALRRRSVSSLKRVVKRGAILTETEYHLVNALVVDQASGATDAERANLQALLDAYEKKPNPSFQRTAAPPLN